MKTPDFIVDKRPRLAAIEGFPKVDLSDYERRLSELQEMLQRVQQAYLGTRPCQSKCLGCLWRVSLTS